MVEVSTSVSYTLRNQKDVRLDLRFIDADTLAHRLNEDFELKSPPASPSTSPPQQQSVQADVSSIQGEMGARRGSSPATSSPTSDRIASTIFIIDLRSMFLFQEGHVRNSINLTNCPLVSKRIQDGKLQIKEYLEARVMFDGTQDIVIYEQGGTVENDKCKRRQQNTEDGDGLTEFGKLIYRNLRKVYSHQSKIEILRGGFDSFRQRHPDHCTQGVPIVRRFIFAGCNDDESTYLNWDATQVRHNIYIGALHDAKNDELLEKLGITHILNCSRTDSRDHDSSDKYKYLQLQCDDSLKQSLDGKLKEAFEFIDSAVSEKDGVVLIHCYAGVSRSAAITMAYLMNKYNMSYQQSYRELKDKRRIVAPNINFVAQLKAFERELVLKNEKQIDMLFPIEESTSTNDVEMTEVKGETEMTEGGQGQGQAGFRKSNDLFDVKACPAVALPSTNTCSGLSGSGFGLAQKRKLTLPMKLKINNNGGSNNRFSNVVSAPIMPTNYNPFLSAFKKANESSKTPFDSLPE